MIYIFLIIIITTILFNIINNLNKKKKIEYFEASSATWSTSSNDVAKENQGLTSKQQTLVKDISSKTCTDTLTSLVQTQSPLLAGPPGPIGPPGPAGTTLVASGKLVNKISSFNVNDKNKINPQFVVARSKGTDSFEGLSYMDSISPFASYQDWQLDINSNIKNRFDETCMTMSTKDNKIYMDKCDPNNANQKWSWDNTNRLYSTSNSTSTILKCISTQEINNIHEIDVPGCKPGDKNCTKSGTQKFLVVGDCNTNDVQDNQVWGFI